MMISQAEFARQNKWSRSYVTQLKKMLLEKVVRFHTQNIIKTALALCVQRVNMLFACILSEIVFIGNQCHKITAIIDIIRIKAKMQKGFDSSTLFGLATCDINQKNSRYSRTYNSDCLHNQDSVGLNQPSQSSINSFSEIIKPPFLYSCKLPHLCRYSSSEQASLQMPRLGKGVANTNTLYSEHAPTTMKGLSSQSTLTTMEGASDLTTTQIKAYTWRIAAIVAVGFGSSETESRRKPAFNQSKAFFVSVSQLTLWWAVRGGASLLVSFGTSLPTLHGLPPVFGSTNGRYIKPLGVLL